MGDSLISITMNAGYVDIMSYLNETKTFVAIAGIGLEIAKGISSE